jgi:tetratricopeptide (TPR) repeat protein
MAMCLAGLLWGQPVVAQLAAREGATAVIPRPPTESVTIPENLAKFIELCDSVKQGAQCRRKVRRWTAAEKNIVLDRFGTILVRAPGLLARAAQFGPIVLYRYDEEVRFSAASYVIYGNGGTNQEMLFNDPYFRIGRRSLCGQKVDASLHTTAHELGHLSDVGSKIVGSKQWGELMGDVIRNASDMNPDVVRLPDSHYHEKGVPTAYATNSLGGALAECTAAIALFDEPCVKPEVETFLRDRLFRVPFAPDPSIPLNFDGHNLLRAGKLEQAQAAFDKALQIDPDYTSAKWGLKLLEMIVSERKKATKPQQPATPAL